MFAEVSRGSLLMNYLGLVLCWILGGYRYKLNLRIVKLRLQLEGDVLVEFDTQ
jgi:hypothetical protein